MNQAKFQYPYPEQLNFEEFLTEEALEISSNNLAPNLFFSPGIENAQLDSNTFTNGNYQAFVDFDITNDSFVKIFDDVIHTQNTILSTNSNEEQQKESDQSQNTTIKEFGSDPITNLPTNLNNSFANSFTNNSESPLKIDNPYVSVSQPKSDSRVPSKDIQFVMEIETNSSNTNLTTLKPSKKQILSPSPNSKEKHSSITTDTTIPLLPKKKRRPRAKKILTPMEATRVHERHLEKNRRAARKCRLKEKKRIAAEKEKHDFCIAETHTLKNLLMENQMELLNLIEICRGMVRGGCDDANIRRFVVNWERREEACKGMLESGDMGVEAWKLIEKCRSARLGEGFLGNVVDLEEVREGFICSKDVWGKIAGCEAGNEATSEWGNYNIDMGTITEMESQNNNPSRTTECDEPISHGFCQPSPLAQQTQLCEQRIHQQPPNIKRHGVISSLPQTSAPDPIAALPSYNDNVEFPFPKIPNQSTPPMSTSPGPLTIPTSPSFQQQERNVISTEEVSISILADILYTSPINNQQAQAQIQSQNRYKQQGQENCFLIAAQLRKESLDSGYGSISSTSSSQNDSAPSSQASNIDSNCWSPRFRSKVR